VQAEELSLENPAAEIEFRIVSRYMPSPSRFAGETISLRSLCAEAVQHISVQWHFGNSQFFDVDMCAPL